MPVCNGYSCSIFIEDSPLLESDTTRINSASVGTYIQSRDNAEFNIRLEKESRSQAVVVKVYLDGIPSYSLVMRPERTDARINGRMVSNTEFRPLMFTPLLQCGAMMAKTSDPSVGTIRIEVLPCQITSDETLLNHTDYEDSGMIDQKAQEIGLTHRSGFGPRRTVKETKRRTVDVAYDYAVPGAQFIFNYRRKGALELCEIFSQCKPVQLISYNDIVALQPGIGDLLSEGFTSLKLEQS
ncbi:hypothetical protein NEOLI_003021 [Neolecta irregularis DAH-3]|uniref:DUF7918 domain-containing protein n=1 Tax=Neolecta irregularis (strain DAH-3) TaxID=1198029 RepID=A0A1U7LT45_NEOID|nr:hypothetical protein NEOLI_003021 [Neolecta irregularis DAH-3]|eukprot:OLL25846.1 hypothetical protein NEOLI_003021 [Neolecta irregularis DAH-3]